MAVSRDVLIETMKQCRKTSTAATVIVAVTYITCWSLISHQTFVLFPLQVITLGRGSDPEVLHLDRSWTNTAPASSARPSSSAPPSSDPAHNYTSKSPARILIDEIKETTRLASGTSDGSGDITADERDEWNRKHPCLSRSELVPMYDKRKYPRKLPPATPEWDELLTEYAKLHRACIKKVGNLTDHFLSGNRIPGCQFVVVDATKGAGLGNKLLTIASSLLYAVLTKRVVLIPSSVLLPYIMCEPFLGSSWALDSDAFLVPRFTQRSQFVNSSWASDVEFFDRIDDEVKRAVFSSLNKTPKGPPLEHAVGAINAEWQPSNRFHCPAEQAFYSQVTWVYLAGCIYTIPKFFASPVFRPALEDLFPDKMALTRILRSVFLPVDDVWDLVVSINRERLAGADRRVGIQIRYAFGEDHYKSRNHLVNERIVDCAQEHGILPRVGSPISKVPGLLERASSKPLVKVFVASLFSGFVVHLARLGYNFDTATEIEGVDVSLVQISQNIEQHYGVEEDRQSFTEVLLLSLSDQLLATPCSTFGSLAQAYGALTPWFIEMREDPVDGKFPACERGQTVDPCGMLSDKLYRCPHDPGINEKLISELVPYVVDCMSIDDSGGIQLITNFQG